MDLPFFVSILSATFLFLFILFRNVRKSRAKNSTPKLPPSPWKLPLIGNMHQLVGTLTHELLRNLAKKYGPLMYLQLGQVSTVIVSSPEIAKEIMKTHDIIFANRPSLLSSRILFYDCTDIVFSPYGDYWRHLRRICNLELLSSNRVRSFEPIREEEVLNLIRSVSLNEGSPIKLSRKIFSLAYGITARAAFGKKNSNQEEFISAVEEVVKLEAGFSISEMYPSFKSIQVISGMRHRIEKTHKKIDQILESIITDHKENKANKRGEEDLVDALLRVQKNDDVQLTNNNMKAVILDIFAAGSDTSSTVVEWAIAELLKNPRVMKQAQQEIRRVFNQMKTVNEEGLHRLKYLQSVIKETLRLHPPAPLLVPRECSETCEINGYTIPAKTKVIINAWSISRDPRHWKKADKFEPERFLDSEIDYKGTDFEYIPFGAGRRICPGMSFGLANVELLLAKLLYHFDWKLPGGMKEEELDMTENPGVTVRRKHDLYLIPIVYRPTFEQLERKMG